MLKPNRSFDLNVDRFVKSEQGMCYTDNRLRCSEQDLTSSVDWAVESELDVLFNVTSFVEVEPDMAYRGGY